MAEPLLPGYHFKIEHIIKNSNYSMPTMDVYKDYHSFGYMFAGDRIIITPSKTVMVHPNSIVFLHQNMPHRTAPASSVNYDNFSIKFKPCAVQHFNDSIGEDVLAELFDKIVVHVTPDSIPKIKELLYHMESEWNTYSDHSNFMLECLFSQILVIISTSQVTETSSDQLMSEKHKILFDAIHYLEQNFQSDPSLSTTAKEVHISDCYLSRLFSQELGNSYSAFLLQLKLNHAQKLLLHTTLSISDISASSGFKNNTYFCNIFKEHIGISALKYRKKCT